MCTLHSYEARKLFSVYRVTPGYTSNTYIKRAVWYHFFKFSTVLISVISLLLIFFCVYVCVFFLMLHAWCVLTFLTVYIVFNCGASWRNKERY